MLLSQGACFGYDVGLLYITGSAVLPQWFSERRGLAVCLAASGAGVGDLAWNLGVGAGPESIGWPRLYFVLAITKLVVTLTCAIWLRDRNKMVQTHKRASTSAK